MIKSSNILILIFTVIFFLLTIGYWFSLKDRSEDNYKLLNRVNDLKLSDKEIDNVLFSKSILSIVEFISQKLRRFEREIYFLKDALIFEKDIDKELQISFLAIEHSFQNKRKLVHKIREKKIELEKAIYRASIIHKKDNFHIFAISNKKFLQFYQEAMLHIFNGNRFLELQNMQNRIEDFNSSENDLIQESIKNIRNIISISLEVENLNLIVLKREVFKKIITFENRMIIDFKTTKQLSNMIFYISIFISAIFLALLSYILLREKKLREEIIKLNLSLKQRVKKEVMQNREKDKLIFQQTKLASLGEMIGNIAHQWRQPLNTLGIIVQDVENAYHFEGLDDEYMKLFSEDAMKQINYMSATIDDFRNFSKGETEGEPFSIKNMIINSIKITKVGLKTNNIELDSEIRSDCQIKGLQNQYIQVLINLIKNAQDVLIEKKVKEPKIDIILNIDNSYSALLISDNGGGIPENIMDKLFEPYFTTKHQSVGTGLGLYMSKAIIEKHFKGKLTVENSGIGAVFKIVVPIFR